MKKPLIYFVLPAVLLLGWCLGKFWWCSPNSVCTTPHFPVSNGYIGTLDNLHTANIGVDTSTHVTEYADSLVLRASVYCFYNGGNNSARNVKAIVILPVGVKVTSISCRNGVKYCYRYGYENPDGDSLNTGYIEFSKDSLDRLDSTEIARNDTQKFEFTITTTKTERLKPQRLSNFSIFTFAQSPDAVLCNNYWYWRNIDTHCNCGADCKNAELSFGDITFRDDSLTVVVVNNGIGNATFNVKVGGGYMSPIPILLSAGNNHVFKKERITSQEVTITIEPTNSTNECYKHDNNITVLEDEKQ